MNNILVLGAGLVAGPLVRYLLDQEDFNVKVASRTVSKAKKLIGGHPRGEAEQLNVEDESKLEALVSQADLVISILPYVHHVKVAKLCIKHRKNMVTTSYVSDAMRELDGQARDAGIIILNEIGIDPGVDHMSAMKIIHDVQNNGGRIASFYSYCGGLPAPEANTNPFGYKFSWSPRGVLLAARNAARYLKDKKELSLPGEELFGHYWTLNIEGLGDFEAYPNRNSLPYMDTYGIADTDSMYRGTLRYPGWCDTMLSIVKLGLLNDEEMEGLESLSYGDFMGRLINISGGENIKEALAKYLDLDQSSEVIKRFEWLGLLSQDPLPVQKGSPLDILVAAMLKKLQYEKGERDMLILHHEFLAEYSDKKEKITSTLIDYGIPEGDTSMSRTVGLPCAIGAKMVLRGEIDLTGVHIPVKPEIYEPVLKELEKQGIAFKERRTPI